MGAAFRAVRHVPTALGTDNKCHGCPHSRCQERRHNSIRDLGIIQKSYAVRRQVELTTETVALSLAKLGNQLGLKALKGVAAIVKPETILAWFRKLVAAKYDGSKYRKKCGRPPPGGVSDHRWENARVSSSLLEYARFLPE